MTAMNAMTAPTIEPTHQPTLEPTREPVTVRRAPVREPPFDDELRGTSLRLAGPLDQRLPFPAPGARAGAPSTRRLSQATDAFAATPTARAALPDPGLWTKRLLTTMFETVAGRRPPRQLTPLLSAPVAAAFSGPAMRTGRLGQLAAAGPPAIRSVHVGEPADGVAEVAVTLACGPRVHAVALRLEGLDGRWRCVRLQVG